MTEVSQCNGKFVLLITTITILVILVRTTRTYFGETHDILVLQQSTNRTYSHLKPPPQGWIKTQMQRSMMILGYNEDRSSNQWHCSQPRHSYYFPKLGAIFTGIPKSGCSNWIEFLLREEGALHRTINPTKVYHIHDLSNPFRMSLPTVEDQANKAAAAGNVFSFAVVRNPWTRLVSGYRDKLSAEPTQGRKFDALAKKIAHKMNKLDNITNNSTHPSFDQYIRWILLRDDLQNDHFTPQHLTLCLPNASYDYIIPLEHSSSQLQPIMEKLKLDRSETLLGPYSGQSTDPRLQSTTLLAREWLSRQDPKYIDEFYEIYKADFAMMNYSNFTHPDFPLPIINDEEVRL